MRPRAGFSLTEMMATVLILGMIAAFSVPAVNKYLTGWNLQTGRNTVVSELKLLRQKAITRGQSLRVWFSPGSDMYWFQNPTTSVWTMYRLPNRVTFATVYFTSGPYDTYMEPDGRSRRAGRIVLCNAAGARDTVDVDLSGWVGRP
jgi:prepilin-type N-terminal cleavage/methylation domain-containing protein